MTEMKNYKEIYEACIGIMQSVVDEMEEYIVRNNIELPGIDGGHSEFQIVRNAKDIAVELFLKGEGIDFDVKNMYMAKLLDLTKNDLVVCKFKGDQKDGCSQD